VGYVPHRDENPIVDLSFPVRGHAINPQDAKKFELCL
jgi:hypothetical protein